MGWGISRANHRTLFAGHLRPRVRVGRRPGFSRPGHHLALELQLSGAPLSWVSPELLLISLLRFQPLARTRVLYNEEYAPLSVCLNKEFHAVGKNQGTSRRYCGRLASRAHGPDRV